jgi:hypothetical protein
MGGLAKSKTCACGAHMGVMPELGRMMAAQVKNKSVPILLPSGPEIARAWLGDISRAVAPMYLQSSRQVCRF